MPEYLSPGVYVEEVDRGPKPIEGVATAVAAFVGFTEKADWQREVDGEMVTEDLLNKPRLVTNWSQYVQCFGGFVLGAYMPHAIYGYFNNGGSRCYVVSVKTIGRAEAGLLGRDGKEHLRVRSKQAGFTRLRVRVSAPELPASTGSETSAPAAGGKRRGASVVDSPTGDSSASTPSSDGPATFKLVIERQSVNGAWIERESLTDISLVEVETQGTKRVQVAFKNNKAPELVDLFVSDGEAPLANIIPADKQEQPLSLKDNMLLPATSAEFKGDVAERTGMGTLEALDDVTMLCVPDLMTVPPGEKLNLDMVKAVQTAMIAHCERMGDRVAILDSPPNATPQEIKDWRMNKAGYDSSYATLYYPWIQVDDPIQNKPIYVPPCGHVGGVWARNDNTRGVHKAPANEVVLGSTGLAYSMTKGEQDTLNPDGINCIRAFPGRGIRIWGARTLTSNPSWRYLNVRRLFNMIEKSIERGTQWVVFEPNDMLLWSRVRRDVGSFLSTVWSDGALFGSAPQQAFYVKCDEELNPSESRDLGRLIIEIGISPVKPAEFVIFRISQWAGGG